MNYNDNYEGRKDISLIEKNLLLILRDNFFFFNYVAFLSKGCANQQFTNKER